MPNTDESEQEFVSRCMGTDVMKTEFPEQKQRLAVCYSQFRRKKKGPVLRIGGPLQLRKLSDVERIIAGYASTPIIDEEGDLISLDALRTAWQHFIESEFPIISKAHEDVPIGRVLKDYKDRDGVTHTSGVDDKGLYVIAKLRDDTKTANEIWETIKQWGGRGAFSISAEELTSPQFKFNEDGDYYRFYGPKSIQLHAIGVGEEGVNPEAVFQILKAKPVKKTVKKLKITR